MNANDTLRPATLGEYVGQLDMKELVVAHVTAAKKEARRLPHILLLGTPGSGKTTLAGIIAAMMDVPFFGLSTPPTKDQFINMLFNSPEGVLLIDEVHEWGRALQDQLLLTLLEEGFIDTKYGRYDFPNLTVIGATTEREQVRKALRSRFALQPRFEDYTDVEMATIAWGMSKKAGITIEWEQAEAIGLAAGGVPRQARHLILHAKALLTARGEWDMGTVLNMGNVQHDGLTFDHISYLGALLDLRGEAGLTTLSTRLRLAESEVRDLERLLLDRKYITYGGRGRVLTQFGRARVAEAAAAA